MSDNTIYEYNGIKAWSIASMLFLAQVVNYFDKTVLGLAATPIMKELNLTSEQYGLIASSFFLFYAVSGVLVGFFLAHRVPAKTLLIVLVLIWTLSQLPIIFFASLSTLIACRILLGIGEGPGNPTAISACHEWFTPDRRNMPTALLMLGSSIGSLLAGPILSWFIAEHGWRSAFLLCSGLGFAWLLLWVTFGANGPDSIAVRARAPASERQSPMLAQSTIWRDPTVIAAAIIGFCAYWVTGFTIAWLAPLLGSGLGYDPKTTGWILSFVAGTNALMLLGLSWVSQLLLRRGWSSTRARGGMMGVCMVAGALCLAGAAMIVQPVVKIVLIALGGALPTLCFTLGPALISAMLPLEHRSRFVIMIAAGITIAGLFAPWVAGRLIGTNGLNGYNDALMLNAAIILVGGIVGLIWLRPDASMKYFASTVGRP